MENTSPEPTESQPEIIPEEDFVQANSDFETLLKESITETSQIDFKKMMVGIFKAVEKMTGESLPVQTVQDRNEVLEVFELVFDGLRNDFPINVETTGAEFTQDVADALNDVNPIDGV